MEPNISSACEDESESNVNSACEEESLNPILDKVYKFYFNMDDSLKVKARSSNTTLEDIVITKLAKDDIDMLISLLPSFIIDLDDPGYKQMFSKKLRAKLQNMFRPLPKLEDGVMAILKEIRSVQNTEDIEKIVTGLTLVNGKYTLLDKEIR